MRFKQRQEKEERLLLMVVDVPDGRVCQRVDAVAGQADLAVVIVVYDSAVHARAGLERICAQPVLVAAALLLRHGEGRRTEMPFADIAGVIARVVKILRDGLVLFRQEDAVVMDADGGGVFACLQAAACRPAHGLRREGVFGEGAAPRHAVKVRRQAAGIAAGSGGIETLLIGEKYDYVLFFHELSYSNKALLATPHLQNSGAAEFWFSLRSSAGMRR